jgi:PAS domain S-box-containing protein
VSKQRNIFQIALVSDFAAGIAIFIAVVDLIGWIFGIEAATSVVPGLQPMRIDSAFCFLLAGFALLGAKHQLQNPLFKIAGGLVLVIGSVTFIQYLLLLTSQEAAITGYELTGRMATGTSMGFILLGSALLLLTRENLRRYSQWMAVGVLLIAAVALLGYLYNLDSFYRLFLYSSMPLNTALAFAALGIGVLFAHPSLRLYQLYSQQNLAYYTLRRLLPIVVIFPALLGWLILSGEQGGVYTSTISLALFTLLNMTLLAAFVYWNILQLDRSEHVKEEAEEKIYYQASLLKHVTDAVIATDMDFSVQYWGKAAEETYGWTWDEVIGKKVSQFLKTEYLEDGEAEARKSLSQQGIWQGEVIQHHQNGTRMNILSSVSVVRDSKGKPVGVVAVNRDITGRKTLEARVVEADKQQALMETERQMIELRQELMAMVSHDFRTPLAVIMSSSEMLHNYGDRMTSDKQKHMLMRIKGQVNYMKSLLDNVLVMNKAQAGKLDCNPTTFDLKAFCDDVIQQLQLIDEGEHDVRFEYQYPSQDVSLDSLLLRRILDNLLSNAKKYSPGGGQIFLRVWKETEYQVHFEVRDQGIGIPKEDQERLGEIFHRAANALQISGSGWGLAIVNESVQAHGGKISFTSEEGKGTTFTFSLPNP